MFLKHLNLRIIASHFFVKTKTWMRVPNLSSSNGVLPTAEDSGWFFVDQILIREKVFKETIIVVRVPH